MNEQYVIATAVYFLAACFSWFILYRMDICPKNSRKKTQDFLRTRSCTSCKKAGTTWRQVMKCFREELLWYLPKGLKRRTEYLGRIMRFLPENAPGYILGRSGIKWHYTSLQAARSFPGWAWETYRKCARDVYPSPCYFWGVRITLFFFFGPVILLGASLLGALYFLELRKDAAEGKSDKHRVVLFP